MQLREEGAAAGQHGQHGLDCTEVLVRKTSRGWGEVNFLEDRPI